MSKKNRNRQTAVAPATEQEEVQNIEVLEPVEESPTEVEEVEETAAVVEESVADETVEVEEQNLDESVEAEEQVAQDEPTSDEVDNIIDPVKEEKPIENKPIVKGVLKVETKTAEQIAAAKAVVSPAVATFNELASKYVAVMTAGPIDDDVKRKGIATLAAISRHVTMTTDVGVFEACFKFFVKQRAIMLDSATVVDGINKYLDKGKIAKVIQFYVTFQTLAESKILGSRFTLNVTTIRRLFNNDALANWLLAKRNNR